MTLILSPEQSALYEEGGWPSQRLIETLGEDLEACRDYGRSCRPGREWGHLVRLNGRVEAMLTFADALHQVATDAQSKLPAAVHERLAKGLLLAEQGHVWVEEDGKHGMVLSQDGQRWHVVNAACDCPDAQYRAEMTLGLCCHRLAFGLVRRAGELMHQPPPGAEAAPAVQVSAPLPEAPASVNVRLMIDGRECQWTLRDTDEARLAERLAALLARYPVEATYPRSPSAPATETPVCPTHGPMKPSTKAPGSFYCTKKLYSGAYCQERYPAQGA